MVSEREERLVKFVNHWLNRMPAHMADAARYALDLTPVPNYAFERAKWFIDEYGPGYARRKWFYDTYKDYYVKLGLAEYLPDETQDLPIFKGDA